MRQKQLSSARVLTFKLAAALEKYEMEVRALAGGWLDLELCRRLQGQIGELRLYCASLPRVSVSWVAVMVSHARLLQAGCDRLLPASSALLHEHLAAVEGLRHRCLRMIGAQGPALA